MITVSQSQSHGSAGRWSVHHHFPPEMMLMLLMLLMLLMMLMLLMLGTHLVLLGCVWCDAG